MGETGAINYTAQALAKALASAAPAASSGRLWPSAAAVVQGALFWLPMVCLAAGGPQALARLSARNRASILQWVGGAVAGGFLVWVGQ